jgi:anti-anti-sigma factor
MSGNVASAPRTVISPGADVVRARAVGGQFRVDVSHRGDDLVLRLDGEADLASAPLLGQAFVAATTDRCARVVLDATDLRFIDAYCLGLISDAASLLQEQDRHLVVRSPSPMLRQLLAICAMEALLER